MHSPSMFTLSMVLSQVEFTGGYFTQGKMGIFADFPLGTNFRYVTAFFPTLGREKYPAYKQPVPFRN